MGDTVLGTKGRVAFEAPAAITLITAHRELEKLVLSAQQSRTKDNVAAVYALFLGRLRVWFARKQYPCHQ